MRIAPNFVLKELDGQYLIIPIGTISPDFNGLIAVGELGLFLWDKLQENRTEEELVKLVLDEYEVDEEVAREDIFDFLQSLTEGGVLLTEDRADTKGKQAEQK